QAARLEEPLVRYADEIVVAASNRAGQVYLQPDARVEAAQLARALDGEASVETSLRREAAEAVARREGEELRFRPGGDGWETSGDAAILDHPDGLQRAWSALAHPAAGELPVSAAEGWEPADHDGDRVLDVGTGSGYQAAVLGELAAEVHSIERLPELAATARANLEAAGLGNRVHVHVGDGTRGLPEYAPYAGIAVAAAAPEMPQSLYEQLEERGRLVVPVGRRWEQYLQVIVRTPEGPAVLRTVPC